MNMLPAKRVWRAIAFIALIGLALGGSLWWRRPTCTVSALHLERDTADLLHIFAEDAYWVDARPKQSALASFAKELEHFDHPEWKSTHEGPMQWWVYRCGSQTVGFVSFYMIDADRGRILYLGVDREYRQRGIGRILMREAIESLTKQGAKTIILATRIENFRAQNLYRQLGFSTMSNDGDFIFMARAE